MGRALHKTVPSPLHTEIVISFIHTLKGCREGGCRLFILSVGILSALVQQSLQVIMFCFCEQPDPLLSVIGNADLETVFESHLRCYKSGDPLLQCLPLGREVCADSHFDALFADDKAHGVHLDVLTAGSCLRFLLCTGNSQPYCQYDP